MLEDMGLFFIPAEREARVPESITTILPLTAGVMDSGMASFARAPE
jgi:hypothetical protein